MSFTTTHGDPATFTFAEALAAEFAISGVIFNTTLMWRDGPSPRSLAVWLDANGYLLSGSVDSTAGSVGVRLPGGPTVELTRLLRAPTVFLAVLRAVHTTPEILRQPAAEQEDLEGERLCRTLAEETDLPPDGLPCDTDGEALLVALLGDLLGRDSGRYLLVRKTIKALREHPELLDGVLALR